MNKYTFIIPSEYGPLEDPEIRTVSRSRIQRALDAARAAGAAHVEIFLNVCELEISTETTVDDLLDSTWAFSPESRERSRRAAEARQAAEDEAWRRQRAINKQQYDADMAKFDEFCKKWRRHFEAEVRLRRQDGRVAEQRYHDWLLHTAKPEYGKPWTVPADPPKPRPKRAW